MIKTYKYRLFANANQERELAICLETHRRLYNAALDGKQLCWDTQRVDWSYNEQSAWFKIQRNSNAFFAKLNFGSAQQTLRRLDTTYKRFFKKSAGFPRFKSANRFNSFSYAMTGNGGGIKIVDRKLRLQGIGTIRVRWHRELPEGGKLKEAKIKRYAGKWYVCFAVEMPDAPKAVPPAARVGIDLGIKKFVATSDDEMLGRSGTLKHALKELRRKQRALSRCERGSGVRAKRKLAVQKLHAKVASTRRDIHHKVSRHLVDRYGVIAAESLNIKGMVKNRRLARSIADAGWGQFIGILESKAESAGVQVVKVDARNTSRTCRICGHCEKDNRKTQESFECLKCGHSENADFHAAKVVLARAEPWIVNAEVA